MEIKRIGVVGAGQMGSGIAEVAVSSGFFALMQDVSPEAVKRGQKRIAGDLERRVEKGKLSGEERESILDRLRTTNRLEDFKECDFVIEAATEISLLKRYLPGSRPADPEEAVRNNNTSSISITRIASFTTRPERVVGMHFFNPAPVMKLIELIRPWRLRMRPFSSQKNSA
jgi:3-hydroxybutyryl-CoA dehydrogenase